MAKTITITSPVKVISSGTAPTTSTLSKGQIAIGEVSDKFKFYANWDGSTIVDVLSEIEAEVSDASNHTVNGYKISSNPVLTGEDLLVGTSSAVYGSKTVQAAIDALSTRISANTSNISMLILDVAAATKTANAAIPASQKGAASGVATLDSSGKVPSSQLPSYVDDVLEYSGKSSFPTTGETGKIYVDTSTNLTYRWSGSAYVEISASLALGETSSTAYAGDKGAANAANISTIQATSVVKSVEELSDINNQKVYEFSYGTIGSSSNSTVKIGVATSSAAGLMSSTDYSKLAGIASGAQVNQNAFSNVVVGSTTVAADSTTDTLTLVAGSNVTLTPDATNDKITIAATNTTYSVATSSAAGLMSSTDYSKLAGIASGAQVNQNAFSNVVVGSTTVAADSTTDTLTLVAGSNVTLTPDATNDKITIAATNTTYSAATSSAAGLMSAAHYTKVEALPAAADVVTAVTFVTASI